MTKTDILPSCCYVMVFTIKFKSNNKANYFIKQKQIYYEDIRTEANSFNQTYYYKKR